ncbi:hypothetical protein TVAG_292660 [Trichomonas vaginalis G3]|uniref:DUF3447 domain-containing protein n=1 Tax=Trichomonas vaginalis (strain ATCC PRA-98 / G3) TaxID=412133 RepID=A2F0D8_TRIV3|nr:proteasome regulatory particle assembly [Trichomonas vaginalis G3]EAY01633.1 hypothetical protein TVAG_292660 [Trichomonas vaginalis G3]KAI5551598.1 proteasome regulatory particle assembly [Trichomonas vaginalis G3]|eukprot:XP_001330365.1 hypothetical protein [Trichomonas vaginalis G3]
MTDQGIHPSKYRELRSTYKYHIDTFIALYQLKTRNDEDLNSIYKMIKTELIESKRFLPKNVIGNVLDIITYNNRETKSYLKLAKFISDDYHVTRVPNIADVSKYLFYKEYGIQLDNFDVYDEKNFENLDIHSENTIYRAIMDNDLEKFISFTERDEFDKNQTLDSKLYPYSGKGFSLLELCCYHGAVDCFKLLRTKFNSEITQRCLQLSFLGRNQEIMSECLKYQTPDDDCMKYAIISHNIDFVTFLMNEYKLGIDLKICGNYNNLDSFLVYFDQTNDFNKCFAYSAMFSIPSLCEYFVSLGANANEKNENEETALHYAAKSNNKETADLLISHGAKINEQNEFGDTPFHSAAKSNSNEIAEVLISHGANINRTNRYRQFPLINAADKNSKETAKVLISHGANINEKNESGETPLYIAAGGNCKELVEILISHGANINEKK